MNAQLARLRWYSKRIATSLKFHGILYTALWLLAFAFGLASGQRFLNYRAKHFDQRFGLNTAGTIFNPGLGVTSRNLELCNHYEPCIPECVSEILANLGLPFDDYAFVDLGSGKGTAMIVASTFPFERIVGVEWSSKLAKISRENVHNYRSHWQCCRNSEVIEGDASEYAFPDVPTVVFLYNTFKEDLMRRVLQNLGDSLAANPRPVVVLYYNPVCKGVFAEADFLRLIEIQQTYPAFAIYKSVAPARMIDDRIAPAAQNKPQSHALV
jgi:hypothetical protein